MKNLQWKTGLKILGFILLTLTLFQATMILSFAQELGVREEASTLENIYQEKVATILNNLMAPEEYTIVISATLKNDDQKLKEYNEAVERKFLPGLIMTDPMGFSDAHNILLDLKQRVEIQVILSESLPSDREGLVKDILKNKLHLNEESGDVISVVRALRNADPAVHATPPKLPELSAKMIAFWIIVCMMVLTGIIFWLQRRKEKKQEEDRAEQAIKIQQAEANLDDESGPNPDHNEDEKEPKIPALTEEQKVVLDVKTGHYRNELMKLAR